MTRKTFIGIILAASLIQTTPSFALILIDSVMSKEVQQKTGVAKLTPNQKIALEAWLNENFEPKAPKEDQQAAQISLSINLDGGRRLQLSDGSIWEVAPNDVNQSSIWITPFPVRITSSGDPEYPSLLVNKNSGISVKVRRFVPTPQSQPQPPSPSQ